MLPWSRDADRGVTMLHRILVAARRRRSSPRGHRLRRSGWSRSFPPDFSFSAGSPTKDEDPSVLRAQDGRMFVAWFSDRGSNPDIYITSTLDGTSWTGPSRVTTSSGGDFNPSLIQDEQGVFHLAWFRWEAPFRGHIWYNRSADGTTWNPNAEEQVTTDANVDDWVPTLVRAADGTLLVYFVSDARDATNLTNELYLAKKGPAASSWDAPVSLAAINSATEHDHLPFAARTGSTITLVWVRHDTSQPLPWLNPKSDLYLSTAADGLTWAPPTRITQTAGNVVNLFPGCTSAPAAAGSASGSPPRSGPLTRRCSNSRWPGRARIPAPWSRTSSCREATRTASPQRRRRGGTSASGSRGRTELKTSTIAFSPGRTDPSVPFLVSPARVEALAPRASLDRPQFRLRYHSGAAPGAAGSSSRWVVGGSSSRSSRRTRRWSSGFRAKPVAKDSRPAASPSSPLPAA